MLTSFIFGVLLLYGVCGWLHLRKTRKTLKTLKYEIERLDNKIPFQLD
jgi:hypothetical protein